MDTITQARIGRTTVRTPARVIRSEGGAAGPATSKGGLLAPFMIAWRHWHLLRRLIQRDIVLHFRGSALGKAWAVIAPLFMLTIYTLAFGLMIRPQWQASISNPAEVALIYFSGLIVFTFFFECINRAPMLMFENVTYIKKVVFPVEILAWVALGGALFRLALGLTILALFYLAVQGIPPLSVTVIPLLLALLSLVTAGFVWLLSAVSVYVRDIRHVVIVLMPAFMFLTPIFYPLSGLPEVAQYFLYANPLTFVIEGMRGAMFYGLWPNWLALAAYAAVSWLVSWLGYHAFMKLRTGFADVL